MSGPLTRAAASVTAVVIVFSIASPTLSALVHHRPFSEALGDCHDAPCPDGDEVPCGDGCSCLCCPGHAKAFFPPLPEGLERPLLLGERQRWADDVHPVGVSRRVFHPPRA